MSFWNWSSPDLWPAALEPGWGSDPAAGVSDSSPSPPQGSLSCHAPKDQAYSQILEHVYSQLSNAHWMHLDVTLPSVLVPPRQSTFSGPELAGGADDLVFFNRETCLHNTKSNCWCLEFLDAWQLPNSFTMAWEKHTVNLKRSESW